MQRERKCSERQKKSFYLLLLTHAAQPGWWAGQAERVTHWKVEPVLWLRRACAWLRIHSIFSHEHYSALMWTKRDISQGQYWIFAWAAFLLKPRLLWSLRDLAIFIWLSGIQCTRQGVTSVTHPHKHCLFLWNKTYTYSYSLFLCILQKRMCKDNHGTSFPVVCGGTIYKVGLL